MSISTSEPLTVDLTTNLIERSTYTDSDNFTYSNSSAGAETGQAVGLPLELGIIQYFQWSFIVCVFVAGITGNALMFVMMCSKQLTSLSYSVYLKVLAISDSLVLLVNIHDYTENAFALPKLMFMNVATCKLVICLRFLVMTLSPWLVVGLTLDRFVGICFPLKRDTFCTRKKALMVCSTLVFLSFASVTPFLIDLRMNSTPKCLPSEVIKYYYLFLRLVISSLLPLLLILFLNIFIIVEIQRSSRFRRTFMTSHSDSTNRQLDSSTRPLELVSVLAFVTLLPMSVSETTMAALVITEASPGRLALHRRTQAFFNLVYILNFGQNFYILMGSSSNYREIMKGKLARCGRSRNGQPGSSPRSADVSLGTVSSTVDISTGEANA